MLSCGCGRETPQKRPAAQEYRVILTKYSGPSMGAGIAGFLMIEVDVPNSRMRLLKERVAYTYFTNGIPPDVPPYDLASLSKAICDVSWKSLPNKEVSSLHTLVDAWLKTDPPASYDATNEDFGWPGHTIITVFSSDETVTSEIACNLSRLPHNDDTNELCDVLNKLSFLAALKTP